MPQLAKGGKYVFGISRVGERYRINVPPEAFLEYGLDKSNVIVFISGSRTSGGFGINPPHRLMNSQLNEILDFIGYTKQSSSFLHPEYTIKYVKNRLISWTKIDKHGTFFLNEQLANQFKINVSDKLVVVRGGNMGPGFIAKGPLHKLAMQHPELILF
ncbi:MAG: hypothetical protein JXB49_23435 [Bacteroidales bacterium]|nr:hypothetical protein [Bacteroidales bacterium]